jgi:hypothetical protein
LEMLQGQAIASWKIWNEWFTKLKG